MVKSQEDVMKLWVCHGSQVKVLGIDLGQAFVVGASALLPSSTTDPNLGQEDANGSAQQGHPPNKPAQEATQTKAPTRFFNLSAKQNVVYQPTFKFRSWLEQRKRRETPGKRSIAEIETNLPPLRGPNASIANYTEELKAVESDLHAFYNSVTVQKHKWNAQKARQEEYRMIADRLLRLVGGSLGAKRHDSNKVIIGIGLGEFASKMRLTSLHGSFQAYFVQQVTFSTKILC